MSDIFDSITATLRERLVSPLAGSFIISWLVINYKVVVILLSDMKPYVKFPYIDQHIWTDTLTTVLYCAIYPAIASLAYLLVYPWPARWILQVSLWHQYKTKLTRIEGEKIIPLSNDEVDALKAKWNERLTKQGQEIQRLEAQIETLQKNEEEAKSAEQALAARAHELTSELDNLKLKQRQAEEQISELVKLLEDSEKEAPTLSSGVPILPEQSKSTKGEDGSVGLIDYTEEGGTYTWPGPTSKGQRHKKIEINTQQALSFLQAFARAINVSPNFALDAYIGLAEIIEGLPFSEAEQLANQIATEKYEFSELPSWVYKRVEQHVRATAR